MPDRTAPQPAPSAASLREAALAHLARFAATEASLARVLARRVDRWERNGGDPQAAGAARAAIAGIVRDLAALGAVNDAAFAASRARRLALAGASRRAVAAHLAARGVRADIARAADPDSEERDYAAALAYARRRRIGPFGRAGDPGTDGRLKELAKLARAGFSRAVAERVLATDPEAAEALLLAARRA
ncbi:MAG: RecX family transcriptional regulator [Rhodospirillales bacterium]|nr:RecX family transcriptional regulator [Rhodospirillales bacterium]